MKTMKNSKKNETRVLIASLSIAAVAVAGATFAWFTSKDEVTNRLSANASYNVAIGETFQPPENWAPGQTIDKDAYAVNSGNIGALARMWVDGSLRVMNHSKTGNGIAYASDAFDVSGLMDVKDSNLLSAGFTKMDDKGNYYRVLDTAQTGRGGAYQTTNQQGFPDDTRVALSEVQSMQSGILAFAPDNAEYTYVTNQPTTLKILVDETNNIYQDVLVPAGVLVHVGAETPKAASISEAGVITYGATEKAKSLLGEDGTEVYNTVYVAAQASDSSATAITDDTFLPVPVEYETFTPLDDGLYLFLRNEVFDDEESRTPEFSGYYRTTSGDTVTYYALESDKENNRSEFTVPSGAVTVTYGDNDEANDFFVVPKTALRLYSTAYSEYDASKMKYFTNDDGSVVYALYDADENNKFDAATDIYVEINMNTTNWQPIGFGDAATTTGIPGVTKVATNLTYYYKGVIDPGCTSEKCVDSVKLGELTTNDSFLAMDFDLNVHLESIQVTTDDQGKETMPSSDWAATQEGGAAINTGASGTATATGNDITAIDWTAAT